MAEGSMRTRGKEEYQEEDMWSFVQETENSSPQMKNHKTLSSSSARRVPSSPRVIQGRRSKEPVGVKQSSAPMNIPDWSKIYGKTHLDDNDDDSHGDDDDDDDDDGCRMIPPHEWIARKLARTQISSFSMCEGIGRTLKGRDLSKLRNAVLTETGFLEETCWSSSSSYHQR